MAFTWKIVDATSAHGKHSAVYENDFNFFVLYSHTHIHNHQEEAKLAFQKCLFSSNQSDSYDFNKTHQSALTSLIQIYSQESRPQLALLCSLRLISCQEKVYASALHPTTMSASLCGLIGKVGMKRVESDLRAIKGQQSTTEAWNKLYSLLQFFKDAKIHGFDY